MSDSKDADKRICELLDMDDEALLAEMDRYFLLSDDRHQRISEALGEMIAEVDRLISCIDEMECEALEGEDVEPEPKVNFSG